MVASFDKKKRVFVYSTIYALLVIAGRNGDITESGADSMADLWASYHSALGLGSKPPKPPTPMATGHSVSFKVESVSNHFVKLLLLGSYCLPLKRFPSQNKNNTNFLLGIS